MARYLCSFAVGVSSVRLPQLLNDVLQGCNLENIYEISDYIMARELPGKIPYSKIVTVEILIDKTTATETQTRINLVFKNEELPLQEDNHCYQIFQLVQQAIIDNRQWELIESVA